ncbi:MAG: hypothetical protein CMJ49_01155 [Planctomycetaceae bacterium]|nr:hypothetical protein [Planctomycetaceae bacterium]
MTKRSTALLGLIALTLAGGCSAHWPYGMSWDRHNFMSSHVFPMNLELVDTVTDESLWYLEIPVGKQAIVDFEHDQDWTPGLTPAIPAKHMVWSVQDVGAIIGPLGQLGTFANKLDLPGNPVLLKISKRDTFEVSDPNAIEPPTTEPTTTAAAPPPSSPTTRPAGSTTVGSRPKPPTTTEVRRPAPRPVKIHIPDKNELLIDFYANGPIHVNGRAYDIHQLESMLHQYAKSHKRARVATRRDAGIDSYVYTQVLTLVDQVGLGPARQLPDPPPILP